MFASRNVKPRLRRERLFEEFVAAALARTAIGTTLSGAGWYRIYELPT
jgi:hypothetical protein